MRTTRTRFCRRLEVLCQIALVLTAFFPWMGTYGESLTPYEVTGSVAHMSLNHYWVVGFNVNDRVLINIVSSSQIGFDSELLYPNMTRCQYIWYSASPHVYEFIVQVAGDYILRVSNPRSDSTLDYTIKSSHQIPDGGILQATPYSTNGYVAKNEVTYHTVYDLAPGDPVLIAVLPSQDQYFDSELLYPNLTRFMHVWYSGYPHTYEFIAQVAGNYILKILKPGPSSGMNYTARSSHPFTSSPDFSLVAPPEPLKVETGSETRAQVGLRSLSGFSSQVLLSAGSLPQGVSVSFQPNPIAPPSNGEISCTMIVTASLSAMVGRTSIGITGTSGSSSHSLSTELTVTLPLASSSISSTLSSSRITYGDALSVSATLSPLLSTGTAKLRISQNNVTWSDIAWQAPSQGRVNFTWTPPAATYFIRVEWSGDASYRPCTSPVRVLVVDKKQPVLKVYLTRSEIKPAESVGISATVSPPTSSQTITLQYAPPEGSWQTLASGLTNSSGGFSYTWAPSSEGIILVKAAFAGSENYAAGSSNASVIVVTKSTTPTSIEVTNATLKPEYGERAYIQFSVIGPEAEGLLVGTKLLDTSAVGSFSVLITYLGNQTYKPSFVDVQYTVTTVVTRMENIRVVCQYEPNIAEKLIEWLFHRGKENMVYENTYAYVECMIVETNSQSFVKNKTSVLETSKVGTNQAELTYEGSPTHAAASTLVKFAVIERLSAATLIAIVASLVTVVGGIYGFYRWMKKPKPRTDSKETDTGASSKGPENKAHGSPSKVG